MFRFAHPYAFLLLIPLSVAVVVAYRRRIRSGLLFAPTHRIPVGVTTWRIRAASVLPAFFFLGIVSGMVALARPQTVFSLTRRTVDAVAIMMVLDCSGSMRALDFSTIAPDGTILKEKNRLDVVKETFSDFVKRRPDDLIGLITFGGYASTRAPLTLDHEALLHVLKGIEIPRLIQGQDGQFVNQEELMTAIGDALATACARLQSVTCTSRVAVLLSDGESNTGIIKPAEAMQMAKKLGIRVYTIGIGSNRRAPVRTQDRFGRSIIQWAQVTMDEELLRDIAHTTGGRYYNARDPKGLEEALADIDRLEKTTIQKELYHHCTELFPWFLLPAVGLLMVTSSLNLWWTQRIV